MKAMLRLVAGTAAAAVLTFAAFAAEQPSGFEPSSKPSEKPSEWNVWVEVLMVAGPLEKGMSLLPELRAPDKIDGAVSQLLKAVERKEATLTGWPAGSTPDGMRFVIETIPEKRYPAGFERISERSTPKAATASPTDANTPSAPDSPIITKFETRNVGATLEAEATVLPGAQGINLSLVAQRVGFSGWDSFEAVKMPSGKVLATDHPQFYSLRTTTTVLLRNGEYRLIAIHKLPPPDNQIEFFIVRATATNLQAQ